MKKSITNMVIFCGYFLLYQIAIVPFIWPSQVHHGVTLKNQIFLIIMGCICLVVYGVILKSYFKKNDSKVVVNQWLQQHRIWVFTFLILIYIASVFISMKLSKLSANQARLNDIQMNAPWTAFISLGLAAPIFEELLFRKMFFGMFFKSLEKQSTLIMGVLLSSSLFALAHNPAFELTTIPYFLAGIILSLLYATTGKLRYSIIIHAINNIIGLI
ncbi:CPBP family intramembrane metalloprotease [Pediococcus stilesii]|uniref:CPBP family intramembrane metalloprotease n=1 Tax=Pediococcus stilesii TaxID=331679 RepID=A0A5R9BT32_9LACO|nr:CPBP family intramembrane glutamic endopeptidase [Pediococcus stilesii]TLQ03363.1 CPBP family intramembrane metalloprotease [Pediococcus stilesii]